LKQISKRNRAIMKIRKLISNQSIKKF